MPTRWMHTEKMNNNNEAKKSKLKGIKDNRAALALVITFAVIAVIAVGVVLAIALRPAEEPDTLSGVYYMQLGDVGSSSYEFNDDGTGKLRYTSPDGEKEDEFTYVISGKKGNRSISIKWGSTGKTEKYPFSEGEYLGKTAVFINDEPYCAE